MVYRLKGLPFQYKTLGLDTFEIIDQTDNEDLALIIHKRLDTNEPIEKIWPALECQLEDMEDSESPVAPDVSIWSGNKLLLSQKGYDALSNEIAAFGEFLPVIADKERYYIFHCLTNGVEDESKLEYEYFDGVAINFTSLAFIEEDAKKKLLFKSSSELCGALFCNSDFKSLCEIRNLKGLKFEEDLLDIF